MGNNAVKRAFWPIKDDAWRMVWGEALGVDAPVRAIHGAIRAALHLELVHNHAAARSA